MPNEQSTTDETPTQDASEQWFEEPAEDLPPRRPRHRLLGAGGNPIALALTGVLLIACGFIGGVLVEKGENSSTGSSGGGSLASRFAALRSSTTAGAAGGAAALAGGRTAGGSGAGLFGGGGAGRTGGAGATVGQVAYTAGDTLYVTTGEGATIKVRTSAASTVTKTVKADVRGIHPGETVIVTGSAGPNGAVNAESIRVSEAGGSGLGALFGAGGGSGSGSGSRRGGGEPALFGG
jgi:hypothetical protein